MTSIQPVRRVILVVLDGLRADAIDTLALPTLLGLRRTAAHCTATTVAPSVTWAVMTTLMTGVPPELHGVVSDSVHLPRPRTELFPIPALLGEAGLPTTAVLASIPRIFRGVAAAIGRKLGIGHLHFTGSGAEDILRSARDRPEAQRRGLIFLHWPDADRAGHDFGWMSPEYVQGARTLDQALAALITEVDLENDPDTLLVALADHGGGGVDPKDHMSDHPHDRKVPLVFAGQRVIPGNVGSRISVLDVPATILWALGLERPSSYCGTALHEILTAHHYAEAVVA
jgi:membrane-anchored protein YejM (alkaline phosphatase superfamily)